MNKVFFLLVVLTIIGLYEWQRHLDKPLTTQDNRIPSEFNEEDFADMEDIHSAKNSLLLQMIAFNPPVNAIQQARNATVLINTPWGKTGAGFILNASCYAVSNKQLFQVDASQLIVERERLIKSIENTQQEINELQKEYDYVTQVDGFGDNARLLDQQILSLARLENKMHSQLEKLDVTTSRTDFELTLIDGTEFNINDYKTSDDSELVFFKIPESQCPHINIGCAESLEVGKIVHTVGTVNKMNFDLAKGNYSGVVNTNGQKLLKVTNIELEPITGGPLLNQYGNTVGLTISGSHKEDDTIYALPIDLIMKEFHKYHSE